MTTISNINIVVQQGSTARDTQNIRQQGQDTSQALANTQPEKETEQRTTVQDTNEYEAIKTDQEKSNKKEEQKKKKKKLKKEDDVEEVEVDPDAPGQFLDVQAQDYY